MTPVQKPLLEQPFDPHIHRYCTKYQAAGLIGYRFRTELGRHQI